MARRRRKRVKIIKLLFCLVALVLVITGGIIIVGKTEGDNDSNNQDKTEQGSTTDSSGAEDSIEPATEPTSEPTKNDRVNVTNFTVPDYIEGLDRTIISLGYGKNTERGNLNRPRIIESFENTYGEKYDAVFIGKEEKVIYLTFTMGYEQINDGVPNTDKILDILKEKKVDAAFFVDGGYVRTYPEMCKKIVESGQSLGCHGYDHPSEGVASYSVADQVEDAKRIYNAIYEITGVEPYLYRPGSGIWSEQSLAVLYEMGFKNVLYSFTYFDYDVNNQPEEDQALQNLKDNLHGGAIYYLHTVSNTNVKILPEFIDWARQQGYEFKKIY